MTGSDTEVQLPILDALRRPCAQAGVVPPRFDDRRFAHQNRAAVAGKVTADDFADHIARMCRARYRGHDPTIFIDDCKPGVDECHRLAVAVEPRQLLFDLVRPPQVISINRCHIIAGGFGNRTVARRRDTRVGLPDQTDAPILGGMAPDDLRRRVYGAVIHHQNLQLTMGLRANAAKRLADRPGSIESGYDDCNEVGFTHGSAPGPLSFPRPRPSDTNGAAQRQRGTWRGADSESLERSVL